MAYTILVVDDSSTTRSVIGKTLALSGLELGEVIFASNGQEALDKLRDNWVDAILADINMPVMNGVEMIDRMAQDGLLKTIPVIVVSTEGSATRMDALKAKGVKGYLRKPFSPEQLKKALLEVLERRRPK